MSHLAPKRQRVKLTYSEGLNITPRTLPRQLRFSHLGSASPASDSPEPPPLSSPKFKSPGSMSIASNGNHKVRRRQCHCKQSRCVKLYCECFASGVYCDGCSCIDCQNNAQNEDIRMAAAEIILERNPNAFTPKIGGNPCVSQLDGEAAKDVEEIAKHIRGCQCEKTGCVKKYVEEIAKHNRGCQCKKTGCVKKYCECFQGNIPCSENCKCSDCKNFEDCVERMTVFGGACHDSKTYIQQAEATISSDSTGHNYCQKHRRKFQEFLNLDKKDSTVKKLKQDQVNLAPLATFAPESVDPARGVVTSTVSGPSKFAYSFSGIGTRSLMADVIRPADTRGLCSVLVVASETAKSLAEKNAAEEMQKAKENQTTKFLEAQDRSNWEENHHVQQMEPENELTGNQNNGIGTDGFRSDASDAQERNFFSTERDDLMCHKYILFTESAFSELKKNLFLNFMETQETGRKPTAIVCAAQDMTTHKKVLDCNITVPNNCLSEDYGDTIESEYLRSDGTGVPEDEQPFPNEIDELICDEDKSFIKAAFSKQNLRNDDSGVYIEQERHVLTCFREFLWQLIIFGTEKARILSEIQLENLGSSRRL